MAQESYCIEHPTHRRSLVHPVVRSAHRHTKPTYGPGFQGKEQRRGCPGRKVTKQILDPFRSLVVGLDELLQKCEMLGQTLSAICEQ